MVDGSAARGPRRAGSSSSPYVSLAPRAKDLLKWNRTKVMMPKTSQMGGCSRAWYGMVAEGRGGRGQIRSGPSVGPSRTVGKVDLLWPQTYRRVCGGPEDPLLERVYRLKSFLVQRLELPLRAPVLVHLVPPPQADQEAPANVLHLCTIDDIEGVYEPGVPSQQKSSDGFDRRERKRERG